VNNDGGKDGTGQLSPCDDGVCRCEMSEVDYGVRGSCTNSAYPEHGAMQFSIWVNGRPAAQQFELMASAAGEVVSPDVGRLDAQFDVLGDGEQVRLIKMNAGGKLFEIAVDVNNDGGNDGTGQLSPCEDGVCRCEMSEVDYGVRGSCTNSAYPEHGAMQFAIWVNGRPVARATTPSAPSRQPVQTPPIQQKRPSVAVPVSVGMSLANNNRTLAQRPNTGKLHWVNIWLDVRMSDGTVYKRIEYENKFTDNIVYDAVSGDPNNLIDIFYNAQKKVHWIRPTGRGAGNATLKVSFRNAPGVTASFQVTVVGAPVRKAAPPPVTRPTPAQPEPSLLGTGNGELNDTEAGFSVYGLDGKATQIRINSRGRNYIFQIDTNSYDQDELKGRLTPCGGGGCSCTMFEEGEGFYMGSCTAPNPNNDVSFSFRVQ
jgi:hypothetical protein